MSCLVEDFRFCLLIGVGGILVFKGEGGKKASEESKAKTVGGEE